MHEMWDVLWTGELVSDVVPVLEAGHYRWWCWRECWRLMVVLEGFQPWMVVMIAALWSRMEWLVLSVVPATDVVLPVVVVVVGDSG